MAEKPLAGRKCPLTVAPYPDSLPALCRRDPEAVGYWRIGLVSPGTESSSIPFESLPSPKNLSSVRS